VKQQSRQLVTTSPRPFVKWAGGKRQLIPVLNQHIPKNFGSFFEPFLGGGAMLFHLLLNYPKHKFIVSDLNSDLVLSYITIRDRADELISSLKNHAKNYSKNSYSYYYSVRDSEPKGQMEKTSRLIFLNRTCFNGLYRVNSKGKFNVPLGRYSNPNIVNEENILAVSNILQSKKVSIKCQDFGTVLDNAKKGDFVYFDPPYQPISQTANFTSYTTRDFTINDLKRLSKVCQDLDSRGCKILLSNSNCKEVTQTFSKNSWKVVKIQANRAINCNSKKRTGHSELLIKNY